VNSTSTVLWEPGRATAPATRQLGFVAGGRAAPAGVPDPELVEQAKRRTFTAKYKLEILQKADACTAPGEIGELLRREGLYTSHLTYWRKQRKDGALKELGRPPGRKPAGRRDAQIAELSRRAERAEAELAKARRVIEIQGKCAARRSVVFPVQPGGTRRRFLGPMALPGSER
jgi:transposase